MTRDQAAAQTSGDLMIDAYRREIATQTERANRHENALLDILDLEVGRVAPSIREKSAEEKLALVYSTAKEALEDVKPSLTLTPGQRKTLREAK